MVTMNIPQAVSVGAPGLTPIGDAETPQARTADRWLLVGCLLCGSFLLGPIGLFVLAYGLILLRRAQQAGQCTRPIAVTIFAIARPGLRCISAESKPTCLTVRYRR